ncbi:hypothetical protein KUA24_109 [Vibrio phage HNL01]|nr:hypothetical protein KUA24_109 [Vibrio phage HNL01]
MIKLNSKMQVVDISNPSCEALVGTLFKNEDDCIYFRPNPLRESLTDAEWDAVGSILREVNP